MRQVLNSKSRSTFLKQVTCIAVVALSSTASFALPSDRNQQLSLVADRATYNDKSGVTTYTVFCCSFSFLWLLIEQHITIKVV